MFMIMARHTVHDLLVNAPYPCGCGYSGAAPRAVPNISRTTPPRANHLPGVDHMRRDTLRRRGRRARHVRQPTSPRRMVRRRRGRGRQLRISGRARQRERRFRALRIFFLLELREVRAGACDDVACAAASRGV